MKLQRKAANKGI